MQQKLPLILRTIVGTFLMALSIASVSLVSAQGSSTEYICVDEPVLGMLDPNDDGVLTAKELKDIATRFPDNQNLQELVKQVVEENVDGIRYEGDCEARGESSASVQGSDGESVQGRDGESVQGKDGESVQGQDGQSVVITGSSGSSGSGGQQRAAASGTPNPAGVVCQPNEALALADKDGDGVVSIEEIQGIIDLLGGHAELEALLRETVAQGITGIKYKDCVAGTPIASPVASPQSTPEPVGTTRVGAEEAAMREMSASRPLLIAGVGSAAVAAAGLYLRNNWRS